MDDQTNERKPLNANKLAERLKSGQTRPDIWKLCRQYGYEHWEIEAAVEEAEKILIPHREAERKAKIKADLKAGRQKLKDEDTSITIPPGQLQEMEAAIKSLMDTDDLEGYNSDLTSNSSGPISFTDIAFVGITHWLSVTENARIAQKFTATSPFKRMVKGSTEILKRETPLDNRQVRYALNILQALQFTKEEAPAVYSYTNKQENRAAIWSVSTDPFWTRIFQRRKCA